MKDRYLYKAKTCNGEWVTGQYVKGLDMYAKEVHLIFEPNTMFYSSGETDGWYKVDPTTICRCTGLKDKNGKLIWENDIVRFKHEKFDFDDGLESFERTCLPNKKEYKRNYVVEFCNTPTHYGLRFRNGSIWFMVHKMTIVMHDTEVIGNVFDNPELLESEGQYGRAV